MKEAQLYNVLENKQAHCFLCAHSCRIPEGKFGFCRVRQNIRGVLYANSYGKLVAVHVDPVEKKPFYHFLPGSRTFSIASAGCNFRCGFCQNWQISQVDFANQQLGEDFSGDKVVKAARENNCAAIAYTYTEPTVSFEFVLETARLARLSGLYNLFITNGYLSPEAIFLIAPYLDAVNIDLKFFKDSSYQKICSGRLAPVLDSIRLFKEAGVWVEVTTLVIPGENDAQDELSGIAKFIARISKDIPWHISSFHADYKFKHYPDTCETTMKLAYDLGKKEGLHYVYAGNVYGWGQDTFCPVCKKLLIKRDGFRIEQLHITQDKCEFCQVKLAGVFSVDSSSVKG
ncbi:MAG: AmmeMemoRadiSam system radical SAM enzyme [Candidatus Omnitrophota bacterium]